MKQSKNNMRYVTAVAIASFAALVSACGKSSGSSAGVGSGIGGIGGVGQPCAMLSQQMSFSGYAAYVDSANLYAGQQYGSQLGLGQGGAVSGNQWVNTVLPPVDGNGPRTTSDLSYMGLNITSTGGYQTGVLPVGNPYNGQYPGSYTGGQQTQTMIQGSFQFSAADWAYLLSMFPTYGYGGYGGQYGYGGVPTTGQTTIQGVQVCNISINTGLYPWNTGGYGGGVQGTLFSGYITLSVSGTTGTVGTGVVGTGAVGGTTLTLKI